MPSFSHAYVSFWKIVVVAALQREIQRRKNVSSFPGLVISRLMEALISWFDFEL